MIPPERYANRLQRAAEVAGERSLDGMIVGVGPDLEYLTGYRAKPLERLTALSIGAPDRDPVLFVPRLEEAAARAGVRPDVTIRTWDETDDPHAAVLAQFAARGDGRASIAISERAWALHLMRFQERRPDVIWSPASAVLRELRMVKDAEEIELLRRAAVAADRVVAAIAAGRLVGRTEADVAREVRERLVAEGHEEAHFAIVGSGPNSASPHHEASERVIQPGEPIVLDIGGAVGGYGSDITRTVWVTGGDGGVPVDSGFRRVYDTVRRAQEAATDAVRPGVACEEIDGVARRLIDDAGFGDRFIHRTGHGIGLEGHEEPYVVAGNELPLEEGHAFSIEPGIYLEGRHGVRIEDIVVCGADGPDVLNEATRELLVVPGV